MNATAPERLFAGFNPASDTEWRAAAEESLGGASFEKKFVTRPPEGIALQPIYTAGSTPPPAWAATWPGLPPFVRGADPLGARVAGWAICQDPGGRLAADYNTAMLQALNRGQNVVFLPLDTATRLGLDPAAAGPREIGDGGVSIVTLDDLRAALRDIDLTAVPVHIPAGLTALPLVALLTARIEEQGAGISALHGAVLADPLGEWVRRGLLPAGLDEAFDDMAVLVRWAREAGSPLRLIGVDAALWTDAGANAVQELGCGLALAVESLRAMRARGVSTDDAASRFQFTFGLGSNFFMEIAKLRAARLLWARAVAAAGGGAEAQRLAGYGRTTRFNKTVLDPHVNLLRTTSEAFAGIVGGCAGLEVRAFDECAREPDEFSRRLARNLQIILAEECQLGRVVDPAGGSYYVETLTRELAERAWALFQDIERRGGMIAAVRAGLPQQWIAATAAERCAAAATRRDGIIGTNLHPNLRETVPVARETDDAGLARARAKEIAAWQAAPRPAEALGQIRKSPRREPLARVQALRDAFRGGATLGEVAGATRAAGHAPAVNPLVPCRRAEVFEALRRRAEAHRVRTGRLPTVFLAGFGPRKQHAARVEFSAGFFSAGGFEVKRAPGFPSAEAAAAAALESGAPIVVICSTDETYPEIAPAFTALVKASPRPPIVVLAGLPAGQEPALRAAGVDAFIHLRANCAQMLASFHDLIGL